MEGRVIRLEEHSKAQDIRLDKIEKKHGTMHDDIQEIKDIMEKIKNWIIGGVVVFIAQQIGFLPAIRTFLGI